MMLSPRHPNSCWTDENVDRLRGLVADKLTARQIAAVLGVGRNAVIGKIHRLGLSLACTHPNTSAKNGRISRPRATRNGGAVCAAIKARQQQERAIRANTSDTRIRAAVLARATALGELPACETIDLPAEPVDAPTVALLDLKPEDCRWPIDGPDGTGTVAQRRFCGCHTVHNLTPYCARHHVIAYK